MTNKKRIYLKGLKKNMVVCIIQARMGSERLCGKVLKELAGKPLMYHVVTRLRKVKSIDKVVVATTTERKDDPIVEYTKQIGVDCFRGSEEDVLARYYHAAKEYNADYIVRATCDNPLVDVEGVENLIEHFLSSGFSYGNMEGFPLGAGAEIFTFSILEEAFNNATEQRQREHVTPYMYREGTVRDKIVCREWLRDYRFTVDTEEDYKLMSIIYNELYEEGKIISIYEAVDLLRRKPEIREINKDVKQKS